MQHQFCRPCIVSTHCSSKLWTPFNKPNAAVQDIELLLWDRVRYVSSDFCFGIGGRILDLGDLTEDRPRFGSSDTPRLLMNFRLWASSISMGRLLFRLLLLPDGDNTVGSRDRNGDRGESSFSGDAVSTLWLLFALETSTLFSCPSNKDSRSASNIGIEISDSVPES